MTKDFLKELDRLIREDPECKKLFNLGKEIVSGTFEEPDVEGDFPRFMWMVLHNMGAVLTYLSIDQNKKISKFACKSGCSYCCHLRVVASPLEVFVLADFIKERFASSKIEQFKKRLRENVAKISNKSGQEHTALKIPCAFLEKGKCSIYEKRPLSCRRWLSYNVKDCELAFNSSTGNGHVPLDAALYALGVGMEDRLMKELQKKGLSSGGYELQSAVLFALENEDAAQQWFLGQNPLQNCIASD